MAFTFIPRTTSPGPNDKNWIQTAYGGYSPCIHPDTASQYGYGPGSTLPNCVGYAWGRFREILGSTPKLCLGNAGLWYSYTADGYRRGSTPQLGAVACWSLPGQPGHVAIVEKINSDGSIETSNSGYNWTPNRHRSAVEIIRGTYPRWITWSGYVFQGFIYNPACEGISDKLSEFISEAESHVGENGEWTWRVSGLSRGQPWCAAFIVAVGKTVGNIIGNIIPFTYGAGDFPRIGVAHNGGKWLIGPAQGRQAKPQPGDLILFRWSNPSAYINKDTYYSDHVGIVRKVDNNKVYTIEGNTSTNPYTSVVKLKEYSINASFINGYYRPDWSKVGSNSNNLISNIGPLYTAENTRQDALIREIGYLNNQYKPSINSSHITLSAMNYTFLLNSIYEFGMENLGYDVSQQSVTYNLSNDAESVVRYMADKGLNTAASVGIAANIYHESGFRTGAIGDNGTSFGLCQWHADRGVKMKQMAGSNWQTNMTGQLDYLWYELCYSYPELLSDLKYLPNNESGARTAADIFVRRFERPANIDHQSNIRQNTASDMWKKVISVVK